MPLTRASRPRCLAVWCIATTVTLVLGRWLAADVLATPVDDVEHSLAALCEVVLLGCLAWAWVTTTTVVVPLVSRRSAHSSWAVGSLPVPAAWRRAVLAACGVALAAGLAAPAHATPGSVHLDPDGGRDPALTLLAGLPMPDRPVDARLRAPAHRVVAPPAAAPRTADPAPPAVAPASSTDAHVVVRPGDTLWSIAATDLGPGASDTAVAARWRQVYDANRAVLGPDPDLVVPGQHLALP